jgi:hypothetical protein
VPQSLHPRLRHRLYALLLILVGIQHDDNDQFATLADRKLFSIGISLTLRLYRRRRFTR